jgi:rfaE bifunctional protein kinase chain/domain
MTTSYDMISRDRLASLLEDFARLKIGLVGDLFLDRYLEIEPDVQEFSIETGLEAFQVTRIRNQPGALGTVMSNLADLGVGKLMPVTVIGDDGHGLDLLRSLEALPLATHSILQHPNRLTPTYTKPVRPGPGGEVHELNRLDVRDRSGLPNDAERHVVEQLKQLFVEADGIVVLDQVSEANWGVVNQEVRSALRQLCEQYPAKLVLVDSRAHLRAFSCGVLKCNESELRSALPNEVDLDDALRQIHAKTKLPVFCTQGAAGIRIALEPALVKQVAGCPVDGPVDIVGAGDSATAGLIASLLAGASPVEAAIIANLVASVTVQKLGTTGTATATEVLSRHAALYEKRDAGR